MTVAAYSEVIGASPRDRLDLFLATANRLGAPVGNIEKDFWVFFDRPDYDLASAVTGTFAVTPIGGMIDALRRDYANTKAMIFGTAPAFEEILASAKHIEDAANHGA